MSFNKDIAEKVIISNGVKKKSLTIEESKLGAIVEIKFDKNISLPKIRSFFKALMDIKLLNSNYDSEIELYAPYLTLYLDEKRTKK